MELILPGYNNNEVHHIPDVSQVRPFVHYETQGDDFEEGFDAEYS